MKAEFSEFSYGFALSYEITNAFRPQFVGAPLFPSLLQEAELGYDVQFPLSGIPVFLQFKLADYLKTRRALYWSLYKIPYFRVDIHKLKQSKQHNLLRQLSSIEPWVYYVTPCFYRQSEFNEAFSSNSILTTSVFFPLKVLPDLTDNEQHCLTYCSSQLGFQWHSEEPYHFQIDISGRNWLSGIRTRDIHPRELGPSFFIRLREQMVELIKTSTVQRSFIIDELINLGVTEPLIVIRDLRYMLVTYFGVELIILRQLTRSEQ